MHPRASNDPAYVVFVPLFSIVLVCYRRRCLQSVFVSVSYIVFCVSMFCMFGEQKMVQRLKEVIEYDNRLRKIQLVPRFTVPLYRLVLSFWCVSDDAGNKSLCVCRLVLSFWCFQRRC